MGKHIEGKDLQDLNQKISLCQILPTWCPQIYYPKNLKAITINELWRWRKKKDRKKLSIKKTHFYQPQEDAENYLFVLSTENMKLLLSDEAIIEYIAKNQGKIIVKCVREFTIVVVSVVWYLCYVLAFWSWWFASAYLSILNRQITSIFITNCIHFIFFS